MRDIHDEREAQAGEGPVARLLGDVLAQGPVRPGSLIVTLFGDLVMLRGGVIATQSILDVMALFGLQQGLVRTALSRLSSDGMFERTRAGRHSFYRLSDGARGQYSDASGIIYAPPQAGWQGTWLVVLLVEAMGGDRAEALRKGLADLGFARLGSGVAVRPANLSGADRVRLDHLLDDQPVLLIEGGGSAIPSGFKALVEGAWSLEDLAAGYARFVRRYGPIAEALAEGASMADAEALMLRLLSINDFRLLALKDPRLPTEILPAGWQGEAARCLCRDLYRQVLVRSERWVDAVCAGDDGPLPPAGEALARRFGGTGEGC